MKLLIPHDFSYEKYYPGEETLPYSATGQKLRDEILARTQAIEVILSASEQQTHEALPETQAIVSYSVPGTWLDEAPALRWIQAASAGIDHFFKSSGVTPDDLSGRGIVLTKAAGVSRIVIGEHVFAMLLALSRGVPRAVRQQVAHRWQIFSGTELHGKTLAIIGLGEIGERVAELGRAFGMRVIGTLRRAKSYQGAAHEVYTHDELHRVLPQADALVLACSLNEQTRGLVDQDFLARIRRGALLVNIARGEVIVEADLVAALRSGRIAAAALDTFGQPGIRGELSGLEVLRPDSPLWDLENVLVMPNNAASTENIFSYLADIVVDNHARLVAGQSLKHKVDL